MSTVDYWLVLSRRLIGLLAGDQSRDLIRALSFANGPVVQRLVMVTPVDLSNFRVDPSGHGMERLPLRQRRSFWRWTQPHQDLVCLPQGARRRVLRRSGPARHDAPRSRETIA